MASAARSRRASPPAASGTGSCRLRRAQTRRVVGPTWPSGQRQGRHVVAPVGALPPSADLVHHSLLSLDAAADALRRAATLGLEPLYMPCSGMKCGDIIYRSTLDPSLRLEERGINPTLIALGGAAFAYLFTKPGIFPGFIDYYFLGPLFEVFRKKLGPGNVKLGKILGTGGFGKVYKARLLKRGSGDPEDIVVKKAYEYGEAEVWMNERLQRVCPNRVPKFIDAFEGPVENKKERAPLWLVWSFEGEGTLADAIQDRKFPENLEEKVFGAKLDPTLPASTRHALVIRKLMKEILETLDVMHSTGIVHRDVKPQNILLPKDGRKFNLKFIDFGAAADLRIGINYLPKEFLLDPRYAPPEKYIMSTSTPKAPPTPVAAALSPVLWSLNRPDRFDMYSVGILLVQMCFPSLRRDNQLIAFNRQLENLDYDILKWRDVVSSKKGSGGLGPGIEILDMDNGRGWDLLRLLINNNPNKRISASAAASHPFVSNSGLGALPALLERAVGEMGGEESAWLVDKITGGGPMSEVEVEDIRMKNQSKSYKERSSLEEWSLDNSRTISWWTDRERGAKRLLKLWSWKSRKTVSSLRRRSETKSALPWFNQLFNQSSSG